MTYNFIKNLIVLVFVMMTMYVFMRYISVHKKNMELEVQIQLFVFLSLQHSYVNVVFQAVLCQTVKSMSRTWNH